MIAIIAILAGMLLPALNNARMRARASNCVGNLKQIGMAQQFYVGDNDGFLCKGYEKVAAKKIGGKDHEGGNVYWMGLLADYVTWKMFECPAESKAITPLVGSSANEGLMGGYGISQFGLSDPDLRIDKARKLGRVRNVCINFGCSDQISGYNVWVGPQGPRSGGPGGDQAIPLGTSAADSMRCVKPLHGQNNNFAFTDGHVEAKKADNGTYARDWNPDYPDVSAP